MAEENVTRDNNRSTIQELYCSAEFTGEVHQELIALSVVNIFLSTTAVLGNTLILVALHRASSLHPPSKLLCRNLAATGLCVGCIVQPLQVSYWISAVDEIWNICQFTAVANYITGYILCSVSLLTLTAISVDRLLALLLRLRYRRVVTLRRAYITIIVFWVASIIGTLTNFWNPLITSWLLYMGTASCLTTTILSYAKIFFTLRHNQTDVRGSFAQRRPSQAISPNIARFRKAVSSALWMEIIFVVCYMPYGIAAALTPQRRMSLSFYLARQFTATLVFLYSSLNPLLFCWKVREVRQAVKDILKQLFCLCC